MKISAVRTRPFRIDLNRPIGDANSRRPMRAMPFVASRNCWWAPTRAACVGCGSA